MSKQLFKLTIPCCSSTVLQSKPLSKACVLLCLFSFSQNFLSGEQWISDFHLSYGCSCCCSFFYIINFYFIVRSKSGFVESNLFASVYLNSVLQWFIILLSMKNCNVFLLSTCKPLCLSFIPTLLKKVEN